MLSKNKCLENLALNLPVSGLNSMEDVPEELQGSETVYSHINFVGEFNAARRVVVKLKNGKLLSYTFFQDYHDPDENAIENVEEISYMKAVEDIHEFIRRNLISLSILTS